VTLEKKTINGVVWGGVGNVARQLLSIVTLIVLARFVTPEDFGVYAILMIFVNFMAIFSSMGTSQVIVHLDNPNQRMLSSIFYFNICMGVVLFSLLFFLAWPIADFFDNQDLVYLLQIIGFSFIISTLSMVQNALLEKAMLFKRLVLIETIALTISSIAGMAAAIEGLGVYSFLIMALSNASILTIGLWLNSHWRPSLSFSLDDIKKIWTYSINLTGFSFINYFARQSDQFLIGKFIGSGALGVYSLAYKIMLYPLQNISRVIVRVLFPAFSEVKHDNAHFKNSYLKVITFIALVTFPVMTGLFVVAENFVDVVFGEEWHQMIVLLIILSPVGMMQSIVTTVGSIYMAKGTTGLMFKIGALNAVVTVVAFIIGIPFGVEGVAIAYAISNLIMLYPNLKVSWEQIELGVFEGLLQLMPFLLASLVMALVVYYLGGVLAEFEVGQIIILITQVMVGIFIYLGLLMSFYRKPVIEMMKGLR
jgi:O-antigen/teichoic acid export membrane protein